MDLTRQIDIYCERLGPEYWAEPVNAISNAAFLVAAFVMWRRLGGAPLPLARALVAILSLIGLGSYLWHTHAQVWAVLIDVIAIALFSLVFLYAANRHFVGLPVWVSAIGAALYFPYSALLGTVFDQLPFFAISAQYWPLPVLMVAYGLYLRRSAAATATGLFVSAGLLAVSLVVRSLDMAVCGAVPLGSHFIWHLMNGLLLGWMIEVYRRHMRGQFGVA